MQVARLWPLLNQLLARAGIAGDLESHARRTEVIDPGGREAVEPPLHPPGDLERFTRAWDDGPLEAELAIARQREAHHLPAIRYELADMLLHPNGASRPGLSAMRDGRISHARLLRAPMARHDRAAFAMMPFCHRFFGHWLRDATATALLAREDEALVLPVRADWEHPAEYVELFGLAREPAGLVFARRAALFVDFAQTPSRSARLAELRRRLRSHLPDGGGGARRVYLRRGGGGERRALANEDALIETLTREGFAVVETERRTVREIAADLRDAEMVLTIDGSQINHAFFAMAPGGFVCVLVPSDRLTLAQVGRTRSFGLRPGFVAVEGSREAGYSVDMRRLLDTLERGMV